MNPKTRIGIVGMGGVGGYFGGLLAERFRGSASVEVVFIPRPATAAIIQEKGLRLILPEGEKVIHADLASSDAARIRPLDVLICTTKSYDLEESLRPLAACITANTLILPLQNGVASTEQIKALFPQAEVLMGCVYIMARRVEPGVVKVVGSGQKLYFGQPGGQNPERLLALQSIFTEAGIDGRLSANIESDVWEKFVFIAALASSTSYFNESIGAVLANAEHKALLVSLMRETRSVGQAKGVRLPENILHKTLERMEALPYEATSSMHSDFQKGGRTEYRTLTEYLCRMGDALGVATPGFDTIAPKLADREGQGPTLR